MTVVREISILLLVALMGVGTGHAQTSDGSSVRPTSSDHFQATTKPKILIDGELQGSPDKIVAWLAYGTALGLNYPLSDYELAEGLHTYIPTFEAEFLARKNQIVVWNEVKAKQPSISYEYMTQLEQIDQAGFLREYVWEYYQQPDWQEPGSLALDKFDAWRREHLPNLKPETHAHLGI